MQSQIKDILSEVKNVLDNLYKENLVDILLYGSYARESYNEHSDIDLLIVLKKIESVGKEIDKIVDAVYDITLEHSTLISFIPITYDDYRTINSPLILNIKKEGISIE